MPIAKPAAPVNDIPTLFKTAKAFEARLRKNHAKSDGLWLKIAKRETVHILEPKPTASP